MAPFAAAIPAAPPDGALLVALGAVPGAWLRFRMVNHLEPMLPRKHWGTLMVNSSACFVLGLLVGLEPRCGGGAARLMLLLATGFLGSFSTFSSFIAELQACLRLGAAGEARLLAVSSVGLGLVLTLMGITIGAGP